MSTPAEKIAGEAELARALTARWPEVKAAVASGSPLSLARRLLLLERAMERGRVSVTTPVSDDHGADAFFSRAPEPVPVPRATLVDELAGEIEVAQVEHVWDPFECCCSCGVVPPIVNGRHAFDAHWVVPLVESHVAARLAAVEALIERWGWWSSEFQPPLVPRNAAHDLRAALNTPADALAAHDRQVRAEALREAAVDLDSLQTPENEHYSERDPALWLQNRADEIGRVSHA